MVAGVHCDTCSRWFGSACGGLRKDIYELYFQYDKLSWICSASKKLIRRAILRNFQLGQRQRLPNADNEGSVEPGDTVMNGLLGATEGKKAMRERIWHRYQQ